MTAAKVAGWPPRWLTPVPPEDVDRGDGNLYSDLIDATCRITKDSVAGPVGQLLKVRGWQRELNGRIYARRPDNRYRHRTALVGIGRKNGKSGLGAGLGIGGMLLGPAGGEVYSCAADKEQAKVIFSTARRMVELEPQLQRVIKVYRDVLEVPTTGTIYRALSAEAFTKEGLNPHKVLFDEVHAQPTRELWDVMQLAMGARVEPLMIGITTAGVKVARDGEDSLCYSMYLHGQRICTGEIADPTFFMAWWQPVDPRAPIDDHGVWAEANPGLGDIVSLEDLEALKPPRTPEAEFRTKRTNVFVSTSETWMPHGTWDACKDSDRVVAKGARVVLGFDGSKTGDSTALVGVTVEDTPHVFVVGCWERPPRELHWKVPRSEVKAAIRAACSRWDVAEVAWDDWMWQDAREELEDDDLPIEVYPQTHDRMAPATQRFYESVVDGQLTHSGHQGLSRHVENTVVKPTAAGGQRITKDDKNSKHWIDLAVATVMALDRAAWWNSQSDGFNIW